MISISELVGLVKKEFPDAEVNVMDKTGTSDHFIVHVTSSKFANVNTMDRIRMVHGALGDAMRDGRIHAMDIKTATP